MGLSALQLAVALRRLTVTFTVTSTEFSSQLTNQITPNVLQMFLIVRRCFYKPSLESKLDKLPAMGLNALQLAVALRRLTVTFTVTSTEFSSQLTN